ncbi:thioredoxin family protein [bacterium]|nr:thioredoxin family protein [bacterium]
MKIMLSCLSALVIGLLWLVPGAAAVPEGIRADDFVESQYAVLTQPVQDRTQVRPGETLRLGLRTVTYEDQGIQFHIYGVEPSDAGYIPSNWTMEESEVATFSEADWPAAHLEKSEIGDMYWLVGQNTATLEATINADAAPGRYMLTGKLFFMACTEEMCLAPSLVELSWPVDVVASDFAGEITVDPGVFNESFPVSYAQDFSLPVDEDEAAADSDDAAAAAGKADSGSGAAGSLLSQLEQSKAEKAPIPFLNIFLLALAGGLILNVMPCVLPVVSIKVISLVKSAHEDPKQIWGHGFAFAGGILAAFAVLALAVTILQSVGKASGWGFQFQNPWFVVAMVTIIFVFGLSLAGVFTIKPPEAITHTGEKLAESESLGGSFFKGALATVLGTPCVGPFLGPALGVAFTTEHSWQVFMIFFAIGVGMAVPYILMLPFLTRMGRRERGQLSRKLLESKDKLVLFERVMAFLMFFTVVYLLSILAGIGNAKTLVWMAFYLTGLGLAAWAWGEMVLRGRQTMLRGLPLVLIIVAASAWFGLTRVAATTANAMTPEAQLGNQGSAAVETHLASTSLHGNWVPFSVAALEQHLSEGKTVLVDFTADWCPNCKTNEAVALNVESTQQLVEEEGVVMMQADWTVPNDEIKSMINALGFASIPLVGIFPASDPGNPVVVDGVYSATQIQEHIREALAR